MIKGIFRYPGGKSKKSVRDKILTHFPKSYKEYRESMVGGGGIYFSIDPSINRWINDVDPYLMEVYKALKERPEKFIKMCRFIPTQYKDESSDQYFLRLKNHFELFTTDDKCDQALRYFFIHRTVWSGRVNYSIKSRLYFSNPSGWNIIDTNRLEEAAE